MKTKLRALLAFLTFIPAALLAADAARNCGCACCKDKEVCCCNAGKAADHPPAPDTAKRYPLKGLIVDVNTAQSALMVKHEPIRDLMPAMTMLFKVDAPTLKAAQKGQAITATLVVNGEEFHLENVKPAGK